VCLLKSIVDGKYPAVGAALLFRLFRALRLAASTNLFLVPQQERNDGGDARQNTYEPHDVAQPSFNPPERPSIAVMRVFMSSILSSRPLPLW
jgi:hypothetical protein